MKRDSFLRYLWRSLLGREGAAAFVLTWLALGYWTLIWLEVFGLLPRAISIGIHR